MRYHLPNIVGVNSSGAAEGTWRFRLCPLSLNLWDLAHAGTRVARCCEALSSYDE